jgi:putative RecB family exonuclease
MRPPVPTGAAATRCARGRRVPNQVFSHSRLSSFEDCPRKFHFRYVLRVPAESESVEGFLGKRVHEVLERLYLATGRGRIPTLPQVLRRFRILWQEAWDAARVRIVREELSADFYRANGERCLENYYRRHYPFDEGETLAVEQRVSCSLDEDGSYRMQGVIDRLVGARDDTIEIHDYKTSQRVPAQKRLDGDRQLGLYQLAVADRYGRDREIRLVWHYLLPNQVRTSSRTPEQLERLRSQTMELIDRIRAERRFEPRPGPLCRWCEYNDRCDAITAGDARAAPPLAAASAPAQPLAAEPSGQLLLPIASR